MSDNMDKELEEIMGLVNNEHPRRTPQATNGRPKTTPRYQSTDNSRVRPVSKRRQQLLFRRWAVLGVAIVVLLLVVLLIVKGCSNNSDIGGSNPSTNTTNTETTEKEKTIIGSWTLNNAITYQFNNDGTGAMVIEEYDYTFAYGTNGDKLHISFEDEKFSSGSYTFKIDGNKLTLSSDGGSYELQRIDE